MARTRREQDVVQAFWRLFPFLLFQLLLFCSFEIDAAELRQLHVITRHGSRPPLQKDGETLIEEGGETLTVIGQKQLYDLGIWLRNTYNKDGFLEYYNHRTDRFESSNLDRTLTSANSLGQGLFPLPARVGGAYDDYVSTVLPHSPAVPIYTRQEVNDVYLRAYHTCPTFHYNLVAKLYRSDGWLELENNYSGLLQKLAKNLPGMANYTESVRLADLWNYYDQIHVARTECNANPGAYSCISLPNPAIRSILTDVEFNELEALAFQAEQLKFGVGTSQNLLGSNLLWQMLNRIREDGRFGRFFLYSAHAPTILGLFSTLKEWNVDERFIDYGSAVIMEVYDDESIKFLYKPATKQMASDIPLTNIDCSFNSTITVTGSCAYENVISWADKNTITTVEDWCTACDNTESDVCMRDLLDTKLAVFEENSGITEPEVLAGVFVGGFFAGLLVMSLCCMCFCNSPNSTAKRYKSRHDDGMIHEEEYQNNGEGSLGEENGDDKSFDSIT